jgi:hypothetical protein
MMRFYEDREDIADNMLRPWKGEVEDALTVSSELVQLIMECYGAAWEETDEGNEIVPEKTLNHASYKNFLECIGQLDKV